MVVVAPVIDRIFNDIPINIRGLTILRIDESLNINTKFELEYDRRPCHASVVIIPKLVRAALLQRVELRRRRPFRGGVVLPILEDDLGVADLAVLVEFELFVGHALVHAPPEVCLAAVLLVFVEVVDLLVLEPGGIKAIVGAYLCVCA